MLVMRHDNMETRSMSLRVVGAGVGRTGTKSLKLALERLLGAPCYHMVDVFARKDFAAWTEIGRTEHADWPAFFRGYAAVVDWPAASFWYEISEAFPDALVLLSTRRTASEWWDSAAKTIFDRSGPPFPEMRAMMAEVVDKRFAHDVTEREAAIAGYERHNADVRARAPRGRLIDWQPEDGWAPLASALRVPVPAEPFPHVNTADEFRARNR
jgi:hypothetical protein